LPACPVGRFVCCLIYYFSLPAARFSAIVFNVLMLRLISKPTITTIEFKNIMIIITMMVPIEPYKTLYQPKLFTKIVNPMVTSILKKVSMVAPGEASFHRLVVDGAKR
jgi:hypothetical protein